MLRTPSCIPIYVFPIVVIRSCRPCVEKNFKSYLQFGYLLITKLEIAFLQFTLDPPPRARPVGTATERSHKAGLGSAA